MSNSILISTQGPAGPQGPEGSYDVENSLTENGYQKLPGGVILQWAQTDVGTLSNNTDVTVNFPITFPNACLQVILGNNVGKIYLDSSEGMAVKSWTVSNVTFHNCWQSYPATTAGVTTNTKYVRYLAIGY